MSDSSTSDGTWKPVKVGGQALPDGVVMRTATAWAVARSDGSIEVGDVPPVKLTRVPVLRVITGLVVGLKVGFGRKGRSRSTMTWPFVRGLVITEAVAFGLDIAAGRLHLPRMAAPLIGALMCLVALIVFRMVAPSAQWRFHGAEHKAVTAYEKGCDLADAGAVMTYSRVHPRCGTNLVVWAALAAPLAQRLPMLGQVLAFPLILGTVAELLSWAARHPSSPVSRVLVAPGMALQAGLTTTEPTLDEQRVACRALEACLERHMITEAAPRLVAAEA